MASSATTPGGMMNVQSDNHEQLLNVIDDLRLQGVHQFVDLPQIIVCGDQSSGKSSVLEAISGLKFPTKDALCTRFATELVLRRHPQMDSTVTISPDLTRPEEEQRRLEAWTGGKDVHNNLGQIFEQATEAMGLNGSSKNFSSDVLRIVLSGPAQPHLTLVDLPGLFHSGSKSQSDKDAEAVKALVTEYMQKSRSIILAVVSAKNDLNNQIVTKYAKDYDVSGQRTLGIITKPDTLSPGSDSEKQFVELAENKDVNFRLGWHVLKNRSYEERDCSLEERDDVEKTFFGQGIWTSLSPSQLGVANLKTRLSTVLQNQILSELSSLIDDINQAIRSCEDRLTRLGASRGSTQEQRLYLHHLSDAFTTIIQEDVGGRYQRNYFGDSTTDDGFTKRIRAKIVDLTEKFKTDVNMKGHTYQVIDTAPAHPSPTPPYRVSKEQRLEHVHELIKRNRGIELAALSREENITALFREQSSSWPTIAKKHAHNIFDHVRKAILLILEETCDISTREKILPIIVNPTLTKIRHGFDMAVDKILHQHVHGFPLTLNHYLTDNLQKERNDHSRALMAKRLHGFFGIDPSTSRKDYRCYQDFDVQALLNHLIKPEDADMSRVQCSEALHLMEAYYKVARKNFIDDFIIYAVEQDLLAKVDTVFHPVTVLKLDDDAVRDIAGETHECLVEREQASKKLGILQHVLMILERLERGGTQKTEPS